MNGEDLPPLESGVYRHYKGHPYLVLGYGEDSNQEGRWLVIYVGLDLDGARPGPRIKARTASEFLGWVHRNESGNWETCESDGDLSCPQGRLSEHRHRFCYEGPTYNDYATPPIQL